MQWPNIHFDNVDDALNAYANNLPWEGSIDRAWVCLAALEYIMIVRPLDSRLAETSLTYESVAKEIARLREALGLNTLVNTHAWLKTRSNGVL